MKKWINCYHCNCSLKIDALLEHRLQNGVTQIRCEYCKQIMNIKPFRNFSESNLSEQSKVPDKNNLSNQTEICPICNGDGGARGGCYKCGGSGWVSSTVKTNYSNAPASSVKSDLSKISNANYAPNHVGANFRDHNGRIGSLVEHDDYSDEGSA
jgi:hypothetical protein